MAKFIFLADSYETFIKCYLFEMPNLCLSTSMAIVDFYWEQLPSYSVVDTLMACSSSVLSRGLVIVRRDWNQLKVI